MSVSARLQKEKGATHILRVLRLSEKFSPVIGKNFIEYLNGRPMINKFLRALYLTAWQIDFRSSFLSRVLTFVSRIDFRFTARNIFNIFPSAYVAWNQHFGSSPKARRIERNNRCAPRVVEKMKREKGFRRGAAQRGIGKKGGGTLWTRRIVKIQV